MPLRFTILALLTVAASASRASPQSLLEGFESTGHFNEQVRWSRLDSGVRVLMNAPAVLKGDRRLLLLYATPNGNSLEQTLGCASSPDLDWHFDIQHVAAQVRLDLPRRPDGELTGSQFVQQVAELSLDERETAVVREVRRGNVPEFLRQLKPIGLTATDDAGTRHLAVCFVMPDYMAVGTDDDFSRFPLTPRAAMAIADGLDCTLMTPKISDAVHAYADVRLAPRPLTEDRESVATFYRHHQLIEEQRTGKTTGLLVSGIKKDIVWSTRLQEKLHKVAIYGWHYPGGQPIQSLYVGHWDRYIDYSHGLRLVADTMIVDGRELNVTDVLNDERLCNLISDEGRIDVAAVRKTADWDR